MAETILEHMERYREWQNASGYAKLTMRNSARNLRAFAAYLSKHNVTRTTDLTLSLLRDYIAHVKARRNKYGEHIKEITVTGILSSVRTFLKWAAKERLLFFDPADEFPTEKRSRTPKRTLSALEMERVLSFPDTDTPKGIRDRAVLEVFYSTGIRRMEVANLRLEDVNAQAGTMFIREGKGRKDRVVPAGDRVLHWLNRYLSESRPVLTTYGKRAKRSKDEGWLFPDRIGGRLTGTKVSAIVTQYLRQAGIEKGSCHLFRHTVATLMLENGADVRYIQEMLGHAGIETTQIYTRVSARHLKETMSRAHPVSWKEEPGFSAQIGHSGTISPRRVMKLRTGKPKRIPEIDASKSELHRALSEFREWTIANHARDTAEGHVRCNLFFVEWAFERGVTAPARVTPDLLFEYRKSLDGLKKKNGEPATVHIIRQRVGSVRWFFRWLWKEGRMLTDPGVSLVAPRAPRRLPSDVLSVEEVEAILAMPDITTPYGIRDRAVIELFYATGMRKSELVGIRLEDLNHENKTIRILDSKTKDWRVIPAGSRAFKWIELYMDTARVAITAGSPVFDPEDPSGHLFVCGHGEGLGERMPEIICRKHIRAAGFNKRKATHIFRHTVATLMLENGADIRAVQEFLGHRSIRSTELYTHVAVRKLKEIHAQTHPGERRYLEKLRSPDGGEDAEGAGEQPGPAADEAKAMDVRGQASLRERRSEREAAQGEKREAGEGGNVAGREALP